MQTANAGFSFFVGRTRPHNHRSRVFYVRSSSWRLSLPVFSLMGLTTILANTLRPPPWYPTRFRSLHLI
ncbi:hypothetical protein Ahy_B03g067700 isoform B [Arachis hypogaea]|uniref:Uncharacterized protein n=1 Tax=Arachis hypogaea TaxID=3818 RepID=A0A445A7L1_ARAHY|nr:hypothetical protein Ahy_B03g067700 isoform B [Arachis hypogaea]